MKCVSSIRDTFVLTLVLVGICCEPASVAQLAEIQTVLTDRDGLSEQPGLNSPGRPVDFMFGFEGCFQGKISGIYALRLISRACIEGSTVSCIICDRWLILS